MTFFQQFLYLFLRKLYPGNFPDIKITSRFIGFIIPAAIAEWSRNHLTATGRTDHTDLSSGTCSSGIFSGKFADTFCKRFPQVLADHFFRLCADKIFQLCPVIPEIHGTLCNTIQSFFPGGCHFRIQKSRDRHIDHLVHHLPQIFRSKYLGPFI